MILEISPQDFPASVGRVLSAVLDGFVIVRCPSYLDAGHSAALAAVAGKDEPERTGADSVLDGTYFSDTRVARRAYTAERSVIDGPRGMLEGLRAAFGSGWPGGCSFGAATIRYVAGAVVRDFPPGAYMNPHVDRACEPTLAAQGVRRRIAVNLYLIAPAPGEGGMFEMWQARTDHPLLDPECNPADQDVRKLLSAPDHSIRPESGDLFLFDSEWIHAVTAMRRGRRMTFSCFLGVGEPQTPLLLFA